MSTDTTTLFNLILLVGFLLMYLNQCKNKSKPSTLPILRTKDLHLFEDTTFKIMTILCAQGVKKLLLLEETSGKGYFIYCTSSYDDVPEVPNGLLRVSMEIFGGQIRGPILTQI